VEEGAERGDLRVLAPDLAAEISMPDRIALQRFSSPCISATSSARSLSLTLG
jgi:hypothetical protein